MLPWWEIIFYQKACVSRITNSLCEHLMRSICWLLYLGLWFTLWYSCTAYSSSGSVDQGISADVHYNRFFNYFNCSHLAFFSVRVQSLLPAQRSPSLSFAWNTA